MPSKDIGEQKGGIGEQGGNPFQKKGGIGEQAHNPFQRKGGTGEPTGKPKPAAKKKKK